MARESKLNAEKLKQDSEDRRAAAVEYARMVQERAMLSLSASKEYAVMGLRSVVLLNGGAIIALLTLVGAVVGKPDAWGQTLSPASFVPAFEAFGAGLILAVLAMVIGYFNFQVHLLAHAKPSALANHILKSESEWPSDLNTRRVRKINWTLWVAVAFGIASLGAFFVGGLLVRCVFLTVGTGDLQVPVDRYLDLLEGP